MDKYLTICIASFILLAIGFISVILGINKKDLINIIGGFILLCLLIGLLVGILYLK